MVGEPGFFRPIFVIVGLAMIALPWILYPIEGAALERQVPFLFHIGVFESPYLYFLHHAMAAMPVLAIGWLGNLFGFREAFRSLYWRPLQKMMIVYVLWDFIFTKLGIWGFNSRYTAFDELDFPVEEIMWFVVIGFCSMFIYHLVWRRFEGLPKMKMSGVFHGSLLLLFLGIYVVWIDKAYTSMAAMSCAVVVVISWFGGHNLPVFLVAFGWILLPMVLFDGLLTGMFTREALVMYNPEEMAGIRLISIPMEDFLFGFSYLYGTAILSAREGRRMQGQGLPKC